MKTTLELPDSLLRAVKVRAAEQDRRLKDVIAELLREGLRRAPAAPVPRRRVRLPLVRCSRPADPREEMTAERTARILLDQEAGRDPEPVR